MPATSKPITMLLFSLAIAARVSAAPSPAALPQDTAGLVALVKQHHGTFGPEIRSAFLRHAEELVTRELASVRVGLTAEQTAWIHGDPVLAHACYASVYPPDPRIMLNLLELRRQLGDSLFAKYKNMLIGGAVARRFVGVAADAFGEKEEWALRGKVEAQQKTGKRKWPHYTVARIVEQESADNTVKPKKEPRKNVVGKRQEKWRNHQSKRTDARGIDLIFAFLQARNITPAQLHASPQLRKELLESMGDSAPKADTITPELLMEVMAKKGLRPAKRDPFPCLADYVRYLDGIKPRFPITAAPWPVLMPLAKGWPLREANDIWTKFGNAPKLPTYGRYQNKQRVIAKRLEPFPWHWQSWQGTYQAGGVCHEMSTIGLGALMSVGVPVCKAGQPHHSCVLVFSHSDKGYYVGTKQGTKGPTQTHSQWLFADPRIELPQSYHMGLALSMNVGLDAYIDTRIGVHLAAILVGADEPALARSVLESAARINPFNTEIWNALAKLDRTGGNPMLYKAEMIQLLNSLVSTSPDDLIKDQDKPAEISLEKEKDADHANANPRKWSGTYARTIARMIFLPGLEPVGDASVDRKILGILKTCENSSIPLADQIRLFTNATPPPSGK